MGPRYLAPRLTALALTALVVTAAACTGTGTGSSPTTRNSTTTTSPPPPDPAGRGPYGVGYTELTLVDASRDGRTLLTSIWYPAEAGATGETARYEVLAGLGIDATGVVDTPPVAAGEHPLVVFSHGNNGIRFQSTFLTETLASHGFVVAAPDHEGNTIADPADTAAELAAQAIYRPQDIRFVIGELTALDQQEASVLEGSIDESSIGVSGHSYGGFTTLAMATGTPDNPADERVRAIAPLAPASSLIQEDSRFEAVTIPVLLMGGTLDDTTPIEPEVTRPYELLGSEVLFRVDVEDAAHNSFTIICSAEQYLDDPSVPPELLELATDYLAEGCGGEVVADEVAHPIINRYVVAFFQVTLAGDSRYEQFLTPTEGAQLHLPAGDASGQGD